MSHQNKKSDRQKENMQNQSSQNYLVHQSQVGDVEKEFLIKHLPCLAGKKVLIVGDVGLDEYIMGQVQRISPEAPVPILEVEQQDQRMGLAANVAQNVVSLGGTAWLISVVGDDHGGQILKDLFVKNKVAWNEIIVDSERPTTRKTRVMAEHHHLVRIDHEMKKYLHEEIEQKVLEKAARLIPLADIVILQDYAKGVVSEHLVSRISEMCTMAKKKLLVDPHRDNPGSFYRGVDCIKPNYPEAVALAGLDFNTLRDVTDKVYQVGRALQAKTGAHEVVLTRGKEGMTIFIKDQIVEVPTYARKVFDVTGAGDTVIAALALGLASGLTLIESCWLANFAAGVVVGKIGCVPCEIPELIDYISSV